MLLSIFSASIRFLNKSLSNAFWTNFKLSGLISGANASYISLTDASGDVMTITLGQYLGKVKLIDLRLTEAIFLKEDKRLKIFLFFSKFMSTF